MSQHKFRASSIAEIMTEPKSKSEVLSAGAKTAIEKLAKQFVYGSGKSRSASAGSWDWPRLSPGSFISPG